MYKYRVFKINIRFLCTVSSVKLGIMISERRRVLRMDKDRLLRQVLQLGTGHSKVESWKNMDKLEQH